MTRKYVRRSQAGRPTKYTAAMCEKVIAVGRDGGAVAEMAVACGATCPTLYHWADVNPEFADAFAMAQTEAEAYHARLVRKGLTKPPAEFQGAANLKYMGVRFRENWSEKVGLEHSGPDGAPIRHTFEWLSTPE